MTSDDYALLAQDYDALHPRAEVYAQEPFFQRLIDTYGLRTALDCACGTGWHLALLHDLGLACWGSDASARMLGVAQRNLSGRDIMLRRQDYRDLYAAWKTRFDLLICMTTSFPHMRTPKDALTALASMHGCLNDGGLLVIDSGITDALLDARPRFIPARVLEDEGFYFFLDYPDAHTVVFHILHVKVRNGHLEHSYSTVPYRALRRSELEDLFTRTAFREVQFFGGFDYAPYNAASSRRLIAIARK